MAKQGSDRRSKTFIRSDGASAAAFVVAGLAASAIGCGGGAPGAARQDEPTETTQSNLSLGISVWSWGTTDGTELDVGPWADQTCFLAGIAGDMSSGANVGVVPATYAMGHSFAGVHKWYDRYKVQAWGGAYSNGLPTYNAVNTKVVCLGTAANKAEHFDIWKWGNGKQAIEPVSPNRQCFLEGIASLAGTWSSMYDYIYMWNDGTTWFIEGSMSEDSSGNWGWANVVCVDLPVGTQVTPFYADAPNPGSALGVPAASGNWMACGLTGIFGQLSTSSWTDGAMLNWPPNLTGEWTVDAWNGKAVWGNCLQ
jgi:hypothetical protein